LNPASGPLKDKVIDLLGNRIPVLGFLWRVFGGTHHLHCQLFWILFTATVICVFCNTISKPFPPFNEHLEIFFVVIVVWGLPAWFLRPLITKAVIKGWIKI
jgi:hypothetical protein